MTRPEHAQTETCKWCGGDAIVGTTCPKSIPCPSCNAEAGQKCRRPSGHTCDVHVTRINAAEAQDEANAEGVFQ